MARTPGIRPRPSLWRRLDAAARHIFPPACTVLLLLALPVPFGLPGQAQLQPAVSLACAFFWSVFRPASMGPPTVFLIGLLADLLGLSPIGTSSLTLLVVHGLALRWRRTITKQGFAVVWLVFVLVAAAFAVVQWGLTSLLTWRLLPGSSAVFQFLVSSGLYPLIAMAFAKAHRGMADGEGT